MFARVVDGYHTVESEGFRREQPIVHLFVRDTQYERHHVRVHGFNPYLCVRQSAWAEKGERVAADDRVVSIETEDYRGRPETAIDGEPLIRISTKTPGDVDDLRELFDDPFEADVRYPVRFLVDVGAFQWIELPDNVGQSDEPIHVDDVTLRDESSDTPETTPPLRLCVYDIEVRQGGSGPPVISKEGTEQARNPITAITAHDSYTDEYRIWLLKHDDWDVGDAQTARNAVDCEVSVYANPRDVVSFFLQWVVERDFDSLIAWSGAGFDHPYLVNWALKNNVSAIYDLSPTNDVYSMSGDGSWINSSLKGRLLLDLMEMYEKTLIHEPDSKRLMDVAKEEGVSVGKLSIEDELDVPKGEPAIDHAWQHEPETFAIYSYRDVAAAVAINEESKEEVNIL